MIEVEKMELCVRWMLDIGKCVDVLFLVVILVVDKLFVIVYIGFYFYRMMVVDFYFGKVKWE